MSRRRKKKAERAAKLWAAFHACIIYLCRPGCLCPRCIDRRVREKRATRPARPTVTCPPDCPCWICEAPPTNRTTDTKPKLKGTP